MSSCALLRTRYGLPLFLLWCALPAGAQARLHFTLLQKPPRPLPAHVLVVPAHIEVSELFTGGIVEKVPAWTTQASDNLFQAVRETLGRRKELSVVEVPVLQPEQQEVINEHIAMYEQVGYTAQALTFGKDSAWEHKRSHFDYTLGGGLTFLKELSGADAALMIVGEDLISSGGRKTTALLGALVGVAVPMGRSFVSLGLVDLESGDLLWMYYNISVSKNLKDPKSALQMVEEILATYPGPAPQP